MRSRRALPKKSCNKPTTPLKCTSFAICVISFDRQTVSTLSYHENIQSPTNEMQFTDRRKFFTDRISLLRFVRSVRIDKPYMILFCHENFLSPTNEMQFTDRISLLRSVRSVRIDKPYVTSLAMKIF